MDVGIRDGRDRRAGRSSGSGAGPGRVERDLRGKYLCPGLVDGVLAQELTSAGFEFERQVEDWPGRDYCVVFRKPVVRALSPASGGPG